MKKFNLMQVLPALKSGGVEHGSIDLANYLASLNIQNHITSSGGPLISHLKKKYVQHNLLKVNSKNFILMPFIAKKLNKLIKKSNVNILHIRSRAPAWLLPYIDKNNIKTVSTFHNVYGNQNFLKKIYNKQLSKVDRIVAISEYVKEEIIRIYEIESNKISVINRGIDINFFNDNINDQKNYFNFLKKYNIVNDKKIILFPGRLTRWKGQIEFLKIINFFRNSPIMFYFVGDDKNRSYLKKLTKKINENELNNNCKILGNLNKDELKMMYKSSNLVISAPLKPEGFGRTISETLSMQKIILAYNFGGAMNQLKMLDEIYKIKPSDQNDMINKINLSLNLDNNTVKGLGEKASKHVDLNFSKEQMLKSYFNLYQGL